MSERITATWLVAADGGDRTAVEAWCRSAVSATDASAFIQTPPGRGQLASGNGALLIGDLGDLLTTPPSWAVGWHTARFQERLVRTTGPDPDPSAAACILLTRTFVPDDMQTAFRTWLDEEHSQLQLTVPGNHWYRGYEEEGGRQSLMNLWGIDGVDTAEGEVWTRTRSTPWRQLMVPAMGDMNRAFYEPVRLAAT
jgi:hypothetical protein